MKVTKMYIDLRNIGIKRLSLNLQAIIAAAALAGNELVLLTDYVLVDPNLAFVNSTNIIQRVVTINAFIASFAHSFLNGYFDINAYLERVENGK